MKKLKKERKKFNRDYLKPIFGGVILFILIVVFLIIFNYNPSDKKNNEKKTVDNYHLNLDDVSVDKTDSCDTTFYKSVIEDVNKIDMSFKITQVEGEKLIDYENSTEEETEYYTRYYYGYEITFNKIPDNVKLVVTDDKTDVVNTVTKDENKFTSLYTNDLVKYTVMVYGDADNCKKALIREFNFTTPAYNMFTESVVCENNSDSNCDKVIYEEIDISSLTDKYQEETNESSKKSKNNLGMIIAISAVIVAIVVIVIIILYRNRRKRMVM